MAYLRYRVKKRAPHDFCRGNVRGSAGTTGCRHGLGYVHTLDRDLPRVPVGGSYPPLGDPAHSAPFAELPYSPPGNPNRRAPRRGIAWRGAEPRGGTGNRPSFSCLSWRLVRASNRTRRRKDRQEDGTTTGTPPGRRDTILAAGARLEVTIKEQHGTRDIEITGNRKGLHALAAICAGLAELSVEELLTPANHYHLDEHFWGTEPGSIPLTVSCREEGWPDASA